MCTHTESISLEERVDSYPEEEEEEFDVFAVLISNQVLGEKPNLPSIHYNMLARLCNFCM